MQLQRKATLGTEQWQNVPIWYAIFYLHLPVTALSSAEIVLHYSLERFIEIRSENCSLY